MSSLGERASQALRFDELDLSGIGELTHWRRGNVWSPPAYCLGACQFVVTGLARGSPAEELHLKRRACLM